MNTPAHLIFGIAAFGNPQRRAVTVAAIAGAIIPDLSLYLLAGWELLIQGTDPNVVFGQMYYSDSWQEVFRVDNSFIIWGLLLVVGVMAGSRVMIALCGAALLHLILDFPLHNDDARAHFWSLTNWKFISPISYWDPKYYGHIVGPIEALLVLAACAIFLASVCGLGDARADRCAGDHADCANDHVWPDVRQWQRIKKRSPNRGPRF